MSLEAQRIPQEAITDGRARISRPRKRQPPANTRVWRGRHRPAAGDLWGHPFTANLFCFLLDELPSGAGPGAWLPGPSYAATFDVGPLGHHHPASPRVRHPHAAPTGYRIFADRHFWHAIPL